MVPYRPLRGLLRLTTGVFFRQVEVVGLDQMPAAGDGSVLFVGNNPNSLMDPVVIVVSTSRIVRFAAKDTLFRVPAVRSILRMMERYVLRVETRRLVPAVLMILLFPIVATAAVTRPKLEPPADASVKSMTTMLWACATGALEAVQNGMPAIEGDGLTPFGRRSSKGFLNWSVSRGMAGYRMVQKPERRSIWTPSESRAIGAMGGQRRQGKQQSCEAAPRG